MNTDGFAFCVTIAIWICWSFIDFAFTRSKLGQSEKSLTPTVMIKSCLRSLFVIPVMWFFYFQYMWSIHGHSPWPMSLIDKL